MTELLASSSSTTTANTKSSTSDNVKEEDFGCVICLRLLYEPVTHRCGHSFCLSCCESLLSKNHAKCPTCRQALPLGRCGVPSFTLSKLLESVFPEAYKLRRTEEVREKTEASRRYEQQEPSELSIFFLDSILPRQKMSLHIFESRYLRMISLCLEGSRHFGMVGFGRERHLRHGVEVEIIDSRQQANGRMNIQVRGKRRFVIDEEPEMVFDGYNVATVRWLELPLLPSTADPVAVDDLGDGSEQESPLNVEQVSPVIDANSTTNNDNPEIMQQQQQHVLEMAEALEPLVLKWMSLIREGRWQRHRGQLTRCLQDIGPIPVAVDCPSAVDRALWIGALINPLPGLGVAPEIRPALLEHAQDPVKCLEIATDGIRQSMEYVKPNASIVW
eukprot:CAMPEP_0194147746 /NCGR_PEP_ID=MMETSP0152-20130528/27485_1 /TAXON_ID=1049557 /ORGANISM="Thalassiothrix antarctica, Strain L6-D1" /LENGTH=387 /DNA_ID=CAMNT_0038848779 /DNA_START=113 /DNA_END=1273 /DNA_ORIENTATION=+